MSPVSVERLDLLAMELLKAAQQNAHLSVTPPENAAGEQFPSQAVKNYAEAALKNTQALMTVLGRPGAGDRRNR